MFTHLLQGDIRRAWVGTHHHWSRFLRRHSTVEAAGKRALGDVTSGAHRRRWRKHSKTWNGHSRLGNSSSDVYGRRQQRGVSFASWSYACSYSATSTTNTLTSCMDITELRLITLLPPTNEEVHVFARVCLSVCLSVSKITQKRVHGFGWMLRVDRCRDIMDMDELINFWAQSGS